MYYVYVLKFLLDKKLYIGHTNDLVKRIRQHNQGLVEATKKRKPFQLIYFEASIILKDAVRREKALKTGFGRAYLKRRLSNI